MLKVRTQSVSPGSIVSNKHVILKEFLPPSETLEKKIEHGEEAVKRKAIVKDLRLKLKQSKQEIIVLLEDNIAKETTIRRLNQQLDKYKRHAAASPSALSNISSHSRNFMEFKSTKDEAKKEVEIKTLKAKLSKKET
jgi:hypothetical protein